MFFNAEITDPHHHAFQRWLRRPLNQRQTRVIALLEMLRRNPGEEPRLYIHDDGSTPEDNIPQLLADYISWRHYCSRRENTPQSLIIARTTARAAALGGEARCFHYGALRAVTNWRGTNFAHLLVVAADRTPLPDFSEEAILYNFPSAVHQFLQIPCIAQCCNYHSVVVVHGNARRWSTQFSLKFFDTASDASTRYVALALQPLPAHLMRRNRIKPFRLGNNPFRLSILSVKGKRREYSNQQRKARRRRGSMAAAAVRLTPRFNVIVTSAPSIHYQPEYCKISAILKHQIATTAPRARPSPAAA